MEAMFSSCLRQRGPTGTFRLTKHAPRPIQQFPDLGPRLSGEASTYEQGTGIALPVVY